ncbi:hypothetical protein ACIQWZ_29790 [Streptomyces sp. NPDC098077]|uniref:hypothetical protein n=1 Tax=Streptomyces sp. NPDC098077 TaxID=3366093 RepID=UPI0038169C1C
MEQTADPGLGAKIARALPPPAFWAFLFLLGAVFAGAYAVGQAVDPVAPGTHRPGVTGDAPTREEDMPMDHGGAH